jgi:MFS superfamily sulfate permease-like transporter
VSFPVFLKSEQEVAKKASAAGTGLLKYRFFTFVFFVFVFFIFVFFERFFFLFPSLTSLITLLCLYSVLHVLFSFINQSFGVWFIPSKSCVERNIPQSEIGAEWRVASYKFRVESVQW